LDSVRRKGGGSPSREKGPDGSKKKFVGNGECSAVSVRPTKGPFDRKEKDRGLKPHCFVWKKGGEGRQKGELHSGGKADYIPKRAGRFSKRRVQIVSSGKGGRNGKKGGIVVRREPVRD